MSVQDPERKTLDALLALDDAAFLSTAYLWLLGRVVDPAGFRDYDARLRAGTPRLQIVAELRGSNEGQAHDADIEGLSGALAGFRMPQPESAVSTVRGLFSLQDDGFVDSMTVLVRGHGAREDERYRLIARLRAGASKMVLLGEALQRAGGAPATPIQGLDAVQAAMNASLCPVAVDVDDLVSYNDQAFVDCAYKTLIGRRPDGAGLSHYTALLRAGHSKIMVAIRIARSPEARQRNSALPGLRRATRWYLLGRVPLLGWFVRALLRTDGESAHERRLRALENRLERLLLEAARLHLEADIAREAVDRIANGALTAHPSA